MPGGVRAARLLAGGAEAMPQTTTQQPDSRAWILRMEGVDKTFGGTVHALSGMSLQVNQGDFISLLGPSGCGKSTALRLIADLLHPTRGRITWSGDHDVGDLGVVFQEPTLMPWATVAQNVYPITRCATTCWRRCAWSGWRSSRRPIRANCRAG
jgi:ABC-type sugar transport system ATPase subunit